MRPVRCSFSAQYPDNDQLRWRGNGDRFIGQLLLDEAVPGGLIDVAAGNISVACSGLLPRERFEWATCQVVEIYVDATRFEVRARVHDWQIRFIS
jgi:hypothetical protein